tara:strand:+ start:3021 stop:3926 length:906 start_codon:yes stop_codon:yes gene_type:complete
MTDIQNASIDMPFGFSPELRAKALVEAIPYIQKFSGKVILVKMGGSALIDEGLFSKFAQDIVLLASVGIQPVVVHGGGPQIGQYLKQIGKESTFIDGLRVTDAETLDAVREVLVHQVGKKIVETIIAYGGSATALTGETENLLTVKPKGERFGFVGEVSKVNPDIISRLHGQGEVPVISTIGQDADGQSYNINADTAAGALAGALLAEKTIYLSDVPGLLIDKDDPTSIISSIQYKQLYEMFETGVISDGMIPKVESCIQALEKGAKAAHLLDGRVSHVLLLEIFTDSGIGTMIKKGEEDV